MSDTIELLLMVSAGTLMFLLPNTHVFAIAALGLMSAGLAMRSMMRSVRADRQLG